MSTNQDSQAIRLLQHRCVQLEECCELVLRFHSGSPWSETDRDRWKLRTSHDEATTKVLCDHIRERMETTEVPA